MGRLENRWIGRGADGRRYLSDEHLYAEDLDIFGRGSLFQLLCTAQTPMGQDTLARWLSTPDDLTVIRARQRLVRDMATSLDLREALASLDADLGRVVPDSLVHWADAAPLCPTIISRLLGVLLVWGATISLVAAAMVGGGWWLAFLVFSILEAVFYLARRRSAREVGQHVGDAGFALAVLYRLRTELHNRADAPRALSEQTAAIDRALTMPMGWMAEFYGWFLQNSFLHALKVQGMPLWEHWRCRRSPRCRRRWPPPVRSRLSPR